MADPLILYDKIVNSSDLTAYKGIFLTSAKKHIASLEFNLNLLKTDPETQEIINDLYLHLHSLKGECGVMGFSPIVEKCEQALVFLKNEKTNPSNSQNVINSISGIIDSIKQDIQNIESENNAKVNA